MQPAGSSAEKLRPVTSALAVRLARRTRWGVVPFSRPYPLSRRLFDTLRAPAYSAVEGSPHLPRVRAAVSRRARHFSPAALWSRWLRGHGPTLSGGASATKARPARSGERGGKFWG